MEVLTGSRIIYQTENLTENRVICQTIISVMERMMNQVDILEMNYGMMVNRAENQRRSRKDIHTKELFIK